MRLKKIPSGVKCIKFTNFFPVNCILHLDRKPFLLIDANSFKIIQAEYFMVGVPMKEFPAMQLYSNLKISVEFMKNSREVLNEMD